MKIKKITDLNFEQEWNNFVIKNSSPAAFLQSWQWGQFRKQCLGEEVKYFAVYNDNTPINTDVNPVKSSSRFNRDSDNGAGTDEHGLVAAALLIKRKLPGGRFYLNCPRGPIINQQKANNKKQNEIIRIFIDKIRETAKQEKIVFVRLSPPYDKKNYWLLVTGYWLPKILTHLKEPENTLILDLTKSEDELLKAMHQKTRYNIRLAERKNIKIRITSYELRITNNDVDIFYKLLQETAQRDKINIFNKGYYNKLLGVTGYLPRGLPRDKTGKAGGLRVTLFIANYNNIPLSAIIIIGFGNTATYLHGASSAEHRNLMPNHALQWAAIKWAKGQGYKWYDFWGISREKTGWSGITRFKQGFVSEETGKEINYLGTFDYILNKKWYNLYRIGKILRL